MLQRFRGRHLALNVKRTTGFEDAALHFLQAVKALPMQDGHQIYARQQFFAERLLDDLAVIDQRGRLALENLIQAAMAEEVLALLRGRLRGDERVLDVGCGNGKVTREIAALVPRGSVVGVDASAKMVDFAKAASPDATAVAAQSAGKASRR